MLEVLPKQELYRELEKLKFENTRLRYENLMLSEHLNDMAEFAQKLIGMDELEKMLEEENDKE